MENITDELREWAKTLTHWWYDPVKDEYTYTTDIMPPTIDAIRLDSNILAIADRIDAELAERYVRLPVDADGVPFRIGDEVDSDYYESGTVTDIQFYEMANGGIRAFIAVRPDGWDVATWRTPDEYRHHHKLTVEDVLQEFAERYLDYEGVPSAGRRGIGEALMDEYAAKLRLADDGEER